MLVSDVEDGEVFDDNNKPTAPLAPSILSGLGWACVPTSRGGAPKSFLGRGSKTNYDGTRQNQPKPGSYSGAGFADYFGQGARPTTSHNSGNNANNRTFLGRGIRNNSSDRIQPNTGQSGRTFLGRGSRDSTNATHPGGGRSKGTSPDIGGISPLLALDLVPGRGSHRCYTKDAVRPGTSSYNPMGRNSPLSTDQTPAVQGRTVPLNKDGDPDPEYLGTMKHVLFLDLDNWSGFFSRLPGPIPDKIFIWAFFGGDMQWREPSR